MKTEIEKYNPCGDAVRFRRQFKSFKEAWNACERGDWMLWIACRSGVDSRRIAFVLSKILKDVIHLMTDERSKAAILALEKYADGEINSNELTDAAYAARAAAYAAADDADDADAARAADGAADAAYAAYAAANAADAARAARAAADGAAYAADAANVVLKKHSDLCRDHLTEFIYEKIQEK